MTVRSGSGMAVNAVRMASRRPAMPAASSGPAGWAAPAINVPLAMARSRPCVSLSSGRLDDSATSRGRRPAARRRSTARFRPIACSHAGNEPAAGSNSSARFQRARNVSCTTSSAIPRSAVNRYADAKIAVTVPVVECRQGRFRSPDQLANQRDVVGRSPSYLCHLLRPNGPVGLHGQLPPPASR